MKLPDSRPVQNRTPSNTALLLLGLTLAMRIVFFSFLDATWWMGGYERYLFPVMPLTTCFFVLLIYNPTALYRRSRKEQQPA